MKYKQTIKLFYKYHTCIVELALKAVSKVALVASAGERTTIIFTAGKLMAVILVPAAFIQICAKLKRAINWETYNNTNDIQENDDRSHIFNESL